MYYEFFREYFTGTDASYKKRLEMFEKMGDVGSKPGVSQNIQQILAGEDKEKLEALAELTHVYVLGDKSLHELVSRQKYGPRLHENG